MTRSAQNCSWSWNMCKADQSDLKRMAQVPCQSRLLSITSGTCAWCGAYDRDPLTQSSTFSFHFDFLWSDMAAASNLVRVSPACKSWPQILPPHSHACATRCPALVFVKQQVKARGKRHCMGCISDSYFRMAAVAGLGLSAFQSDCAR